MKNYRHQMVQLSMIVFSSISLMGAQADGTAECNVGSGIGSLECGGFADASGLSSTAVGAHADATAFGSTSVGAGADADGEGSTGVGHSANATAKFSTAMGENATATAELSTAVGNGASARSEGAVSLGYRAGINDLDSEQAIAIGNYANIGEISRGAIAIGGDVDGDNKGADASFGSAIAIGADATAGFESTAVGTISSASGSATVALGQSSSAIGPLSIALGQDSDVDVNSSHAIALGEDAKIINAPGGIAIGSDYKNVDTGATVTASLAIAIGANSAATQPGAIAIGADVVADKANTMTVGVPIEVVRDETAKVFVEDTSPTTIARTLFEIKNNGNTKFTISNSNAMEKWAFANPGTGFRLSRQGSGSVEFEVKNNGNAELAGVLTENSDINAKQDILSLDQQSILDKVMALDITEWRYKDDPESRHIGPMAQDFYQTFELGDTDKGISTLDSSGVALVAIQALKKENLEKDQKIAELINQNKVLSERMQKMEDNLTEIDTLKQQLASILAMTGVAQLTQIVSK